MDEKSVRERYAEMVQQPYDVDVIRQAPDLEPGEEHPSVVEVQNYLKRFGYLDAAFAEGRTAERGRLDEVTVRALIEYQHFFGAGSGYGNLDAPTRESMAEPRCGIPDVEPGGMLPGLEDRHVIGCPEGWHRRFFTYAFGNMTRDVPTVMAEALVARGFGAWARVQFPDGSGSVLSFYRVEASESPDFMVEWKDASDADSSMVGDVIAHSDFPHGCLYVPELKLGKAKPLHFDDSEHTWCMGARPDRIDIQTTTIHEMGHLLGLRHSGAPESIMWPTIPINATKSLVEDDTNGLKFLFVARHPSRMIHNIAPAHSMFKVLDVAGASQVNGARVQLWDSLRGSNQSFRPEYVGRGAFRFVAEHSGKVLTVEGGSTRKGAQIIQWDWHDGDNQRFQVLNPQGTPQQQVIAVHSGLVLDVSGASQANGAKIMQWTPALGFRNQLFSFTPDWL
jgi:hypothetical protein